MKDKPSIWSDSVSTEDLERELERRKRELRGPPTPLKEPDFSNLQELVVEGTKASVQNGYEDDDFQHYVYEAAMEAVFGKDFWTWRNKQKW